MTETAEVANVPKEIREWLEKSNVLTPNDLAMMATDEKEVRPYISALMIADSVKDADKPAGIIAVKKLWFACRDIYEEGRRTNRDPSVVVDAPIPVPDEKNIVAKWTARHNFILPDSQLLIPNHQGKMWRDFQLDKPAISIWLAETLRTRSCIHKSVGTQLAVTPGKVPEAIGVIADKVDRSLELFIRIRAFFMTLSYVSVTDPDWSPLQVAMQASDQVLNYISAEYNGRAPPLRLPRRGVGGHDPLLLRSSADAGRDPGQNHRKHRSLGAQMDLASFERLERGECRNALCRQQSPAKSA